MILLEEKLRTLRLLAGLARPGRDGTPSKWIMGRFRGDCNATPVRIASDHENGAATVLPVPLDEPGPIQHLTNIYCRQPMCPELVFVVVVEDEFIDLPPHLDDCSYIA